MGNKSIFLLVTRSLTKRCEWSYEDIFFLVILKARGAFKGR